MKTVLSLIGSILLVNISIDQTDHEAQNGSGKDYSRFNHKVFKVLVVSLLINFTIVESVK
jgi:hypothetical protein